MKPVDDQLYEVYLLRLWRHSTDAPWRVTLESAESGSQQHFATIEALAQFLETNTNQSKTQAK